MSLPCPTKAKLAPFPFSPNTGGTYVPICTLTLSASTILSPLLISTNLSISPLTRVVTANSSLPLLSFNASGNTSRIEPLTKASKVAEFHIGGSRSDNEETLEVGLRDLKKNNGFESRRILVELERRCRCRSQKMREEALVRVVV
ncbi:hypothetical protein M5689_001699 [Euphorbia peplus]|nr:hypothetical protein M5689_001699 [Euphorbia peplus]